MAKEIQPKDTTRAAAYEFWMKAPNPMVTFFKTLDVTNLMKISRRKRMKFHMLMDYCIGRAAAGIKEFYILPVGDRLMQYDTLAVNTIVKNKDGEVSSCDILFVDDLGEYNRQYLKYTSRTARTCRDRDLSENSMVIGTSAMPECTIDSAVNIYTGVFNNPFLIWGRRRRRFLRAELPISLQFHHVQLDGGDAARYFLSLQGEMDGLCD